MERSRRQFLALAALTPLAFAVSAAAKANSASCYDPATLSLSLRNRRKALGFVEASTDPARRCGLCAFFESKGGDCGTCQLLIGAPVTASGACNSFAAKAR
ncbi:MAG: hypothetical protein EOP13_00160 [Pseudomonas sp.]|uniref:high-potential iron-sulfur protein n=1 Tax=Pseudomonas sp. TaxID=306 RepID=UPI00121788D7|nr:high-potential iron-sulfur protein [Pseudomonas sp.]RZI76940.1 MAG: hypothetical protein EOP13_00160 [Pseudomonas sp.]